MNTLTKTYFEKGDFRNTCQQVASLKAIDFVVNDGYLLLDLPYRKVSYGMVKGDVLEEETSFFDIMESVSGWLYTIEEYGNIYMYVDDLDYDPDDVKPWFELYEDVKQLFSEIESEDNYGVLYIKEDETYSSDDVPCPNCLLECLGAEYSEYFECYLEEPLSGTVITARSGEIGTEELFNDNCDFEYRNGEWVNIYSSEYDEDEDEEDYDPVIYDYHCYSHEYVPFSTGDEPISSTGERLFLGTELEVDYTEDSNYYIACHALEMLDSSDNIRFHCESDSSVEFEFISQPMTIEYRKEKFSSSEENTLEYLKGVCKSHDAGTCGLHVHVNRNFFSDESYKKLKTILEFFKPELFIFSRRQSLSYGYARFVDSSIDGTTNESSDIKDMKEYRKDINHVKPEKVYKNKLEGHDVWYNEDSGDTFEFRMFRGTLKFETLQATLELVRNICFIANDETKNVISWNDIVTGFGEEYGDSSYCVNYSKERGIFDSELVLDYQKALDAEMKDFNAQLDVFKDKRAKLISLLEYLCEYCWYWDNSLSSFRMCYDEFQDRIHVKTTTLNVRNEKIRNIIHFDSDLYWCSVYMKDDINTDSIEREMDYVNSAIDNAQKVIDEFESEPKWVLDDLFKEFTSRYKTVKD